MKRLRENTAGSCALQAVRRPIVETLMEAVLLADSVLEHAGDLSPANPQVNAVLSRLVGLVGFPYTPDEELAIAGDKRIDAVRRRLLGKLSAAEAAMELHYAQRLARQRTLTPDTLRTFIYYNNYEALLQMELQQMRALGLLTEGVLSEPAACIGSGPLPLSALLLHAATGMRVACIDSDSGACRAAESLIRRLGLGDALTVIHEAGERYDYTPHPLTLLASLVPDKPAVAARIRATRPGAALAVRSVEGVRTLLYEPVDEAAMERAGCRKLGQTAGDRYVINSTLFYRLLP